VLRNELNLPFSHNMFFYYSLFPISCLGFIASVIESNIDSHHAHELNKITLMMSPKRKVTRTSQSMEAILQEPRVEAPHQANGVLDQRPLTTLYYNKYQTANPNFTSTFAAMTANLGQDTKGNKEDFEGPGTLNIGKHKTLTALHVGGSSPCSN
jgi:hypothetical protein